MTATAPAPAFERSQTKKCARARRPRMERRIPPLRASRARGERGKLDGR